MGPLPGAEWDGAYFDAQSAVRHTVKVTLAPRGLWIRKPDGSTLWWPYEELRQTAGFHPGEQVRFENGHPLPEAIVFRDQSILAAIRHFHPGVGLWPASSSRRFWMRLAVLAAACVVMLPVLYFWALPAAGEALAEVVPVSWEKRLGAVVLEQMAAADKRCGSPELETVLRTLEAASPPSPYTFRLFLVDDPMVNAFAAPGGYIVVFRGLLETTGSPHELAAVVAHEMQHVHYRHGTRALMRAVTLKALLALIAGDTQGTLIDLAGLLGELHYRRQDEEAADRGAMQMIRRARLDPQGMIRLMRTLEEESRRTPALARYFSTHPAPGERLREMERLAAQSAYEPVPLLAGKPWPPSLGCSRQAP